MRRDHIVFRRSRFFHGAPTPGTSVKDITWLRPDGGEKQETDWNVSFAHCLGFVISGDAGEYHLTIGGEPETDDTFLVIMNASEKVVDYKLPAFESTEGWLRILDTCSADGRADGERVSPGAAVPVTAHSLLVFVRYGDRKSQAQDRRLMRRIHRMPFGAEIDEAGVARFRLWAPGAGRVGLCTEIRQRVDGTDDTVGWGLARDQGR